MKLFEPQFLMFAILAVVLLIYGPKRLPELGKTIGQGIRAVRDGVDGKQDEQPIAEASAKPAEATAAPQEKVEA